MSFELKILGANSATPAYGRFPTSQLLTVENQYFLIDCGEGCQIQLSRFKAKVSRISRVFISHLHGDHFFGLIGLLNTFNLGGRTQDLTLYGPADLADIITVQLRQSRTVLKYKVHFVAVLPDVPLLLWEDERLTISTIPMNHRIACTGFLFREKEKPRRINKETMPPDLSIEDIKALKQGEDLYGPDGFLRYHNEDLTRPPRRSRAYAYCSDTRYETAITDLVRGVDLLYHEATFMHDEADLAAERFHSTTVQAATLAKEAEVGTLLIGHYSSRYKDLTPLLAETRAVFPNTELALEGKDYAISDA